MAHNYKISFEAELNLNQMKGALNQLQSQLANLKFPPSMTKSVTDTFSKLSDEIRNFEELRNKGIKSPADFTKLEASGEKIISLYEKLKKSAGDLSKISGKDLEKLFPSSAIDTINKARQALTAYENEVKKATTKVDDLNKKIQAQQNLTREAETTKKTAEAAMPSAQSDLDKVSKTIQDKTGITDTSAALQKLIEDYTKAEEAAKKYEEAIARGETISPAQKGVITRKNNLGALIDTYTNAAKKVQELQNTINSAEGDINKSVSEIEKLNESLKKAQAEQEVSKSNALTALLDSMKELNDIDMSKYEQSFEGAKQALNDFIDANGLAAKGQVENFLKALESSGINVEDLRKKLRDLGQQVADTDSRMKEISALKSRIQYFFGLSNAINLVKRAIRGAVDTIKELDKVMTETAVVTDFSVSDMWEQLPAYTKRANELGVTTKAAYEAATLYYQQGLKTNEVNALSVETLKMARIAGLDAAEATDRMTNALRGFNMELTEANAQRVDDVYSELAANTASNVDEISTAMTKVASLAHNANMEFETTAAFLAQIIETTRESAETAGTALKTVVARFSEVKKLVSEGQLTGTDEEGEAIDVNKVGIALRTAGIDLNKYFMGEVGLDDIFMELASKWDTLTSVQQRYIATQAAGSRQQSRFIAMMQDYARTQELVSKAYNANGASAKQFAKTQESLESKLNRLKNAWNEFLMGLTNNNIVKGFVDLFTNLLNIINKLTDAFGESGSSIAKWGIAIGGLAAGSSLFKNGGLIEKILGNSFLSNFLKLDNGSVESQDIFNKIITSYQEGGYLNSILGANSKLRSKLTNGGSFLDLSSSIKRLGDSFEKIIVSIQAAGVALRSFLATAAPLIGIAAAIAGFATLTAYNEKQYARRNDPTIVLKEQVDQAKEFAEKAKDISSELDEVAQKWKNIQQQQSEGLSNINNAGSIEEYRKAVQNQNEYVKSLIEQDAAYTQYIQSVEGLNGEIILTLDEEALANAANKAAEAAVKAAAAGYFSEATASGASQAWLQGNIDKLDSIYQEKDGKYYRTSPTGYAVVPGQAGMPSMTVATPSATIEIEEAEYKRIQGQKALYQQQISETNSAIIANATRGFQELANANAGISTSDAFLIASILGQNFKVEEYNDLVATQIAALNTEAQEFHDTMSREAYMRQEYASIFGTEANERWDADVIARYIATARIGVQDQNRISAVNDLISSDENARALAQAFNGEIELNVSNIQDLLPQAEALAAAMGTNLDDFAKQLVKSQKALAIKREQASNWYGQQILAAGGTITGRGETPALIDTLNQFPLEKINALNLMGEKLSNIVAPEDLSEFLQQLPLEAEKGSESFERIYGFLATFNLNKPIQAYKQLALAEQEAADANDDLFKAVIESTRSANQDLLSLSGLFKSFVGSDAYTNIEKNITKLIKKNGQLTADNINELADSCDDLADLLALDEVNAEGLAIALTALNKGEIPLEAFNDVLLKVLSNLPSVQKEIDKLHEHIKNFDKGLDYREPEEFFEGLADELKENLKLYEFGNERTIKLYEGFFGEGSYAAQYANLTKKGFDKKKISEVLTGQITTATGLLDNGTYQFMHQFAGKKIGLGITEGKNGDFSWDVGNKTTDQLITQIQDTYKREKGIKIGRDFAMALLEGWLGQSYETKQELNENDYKAALENLKTEASDLGTITEEQLALIAQQYGKTLEQAKKDLADLGIITIQVNGPDGKPLTGKSLYDEIKKFTNPKDWNTQITDQEGTTHTAIDANRQIQDLTSHGFSYDQAVEALQHFASENEAVLAAQVKKYNQETGETTTEWVTAKTKADLDAAVDIAQKEFDAAIQAAATTSGLGDAFADAVNSVDWASIGDTVGQRVAAAVKEALADDSDTNANNIAPENKIGNNVAKGIGEGSANGSSTASENVGKGTSTGATAGWNTFSTWLASQPPIPIPFTFSPTGGLPGVGGATGGIVKSRAGGSSRELSPGWALTGEEGKEIIWNKNGGYAYITGDNGPQFQNLQPGDRVFNAAETAKILRNSFAKGGIYHSYGNGGYNLDEINKGKGGKGGSSSSGKAEKQSTWRNELDWLYDLMEDIAEYERQQSITQAKYDLALNDIHTTGRDLYKLTKTELNNLNTQLTAQQAALTKRTQEMGELQKLVNAKGYGKYVQWNQKDQTLEINWDSIEKITDKEQYDEITDYLNRMEEVQGKMDDATNKIYDIKKQIQDLQDRYLQKYLDFQDRIRDALVKQYQDQIDHLSELNDTLDNTNSEILESIQKEIDLERQIRDNTKTESDIADKEARLAYLQRDTTGANATQIRQLEKELEEARENYSDTLVDQALDRLSEANDKAAEQRNKQVELMQAQLDYWQKSGALWDEINGLIADGFDINGSIIGTSDLVQILKDAEEWEGLSSAQRENWANELILETNEVGAHIITLTEGMKTSSEQVRALLNSLTSKLGGTPVHSFTAEKTEEKYANGGLNTYTGWAHLDGTPSEPEYVLNARQTDAFLRLAEILPAAMGSGVTTNTYGGNIYLDINMNVDQISSDYDVDRIADRVKDIIYNASSYRNVNILNFGR